MAAVFAVLGGRLYQLQIRDGDQYMVEAEDNRISERLLAPPRGRIIDRFGVELANQPAQLSRAAGERAGHRRRGGGAGHRSAR